MQNSLSSNIAGMKDVALFNMNNDGKRIAMGDATRRSTLSHPINNAKAGEEEKLRNLCDDFESIFLKQMMKAMRKTVEKSGLMDGGMGEEVFQDMLDGEVAQDAARSRSLGISDMLFAQLSKTQKALPPTRYQSY